MKKQLIFNESQERLVVDILKRGGVGVLPTDTLYGIVGSALLPETVERIYLLRKRNKTKPLIILISDLHELETFGVVRSEKTDKLLQTIWPGRISVALECLMEKSPYLHRGKKTLAFRKPADKWLLDLLNKTGPLVAPSANIEGEKAATTIKEAKAYFADKVDFYVDFGKLSSKPSTLVEIRSSELKILRQGAVKIKKQDLSDL